MDNRRLTQSSPAPEPSNPPPIETYCALVGHYLISDDPRLRRQAAEFWAAMAKRHLQGARA